MLSAAAVIIPTVWLPNLRALSYLGVCGITATASVAASVSSFLYSPVHYNVVPCTLVTTERNDICGNLVTPGILMHDASRLG